MQVHDAESCLMATDDSNILSEQPHQYKTSPSSPVQSREASKSVPTFAVYTSESKPTSASHPTQLKLAGHLNRILFILILKVNKTKNNSLYIMEFRLIRKCKMKQVE